MQDFGAVGCHDVIALFFGIFERRCQNENSLVSRLQFFLRFFPNMKTKVFPLHYLAVGLLHHLCLSAPALLSLAQLPGERFRQIQYEYIVRK